jgi:integrase
MASNMCKQNGLLQRGRTFYFQARIPKDVIGHFSIGGRKRAIIRERLPATTHAEAKAQVRQRWAELEARIAEIRRPPGSETARRCMPQAEAQRIAAHIVAHCLGHDEEARLQGRSQDEWEDMERRLEQADIEDRNAIARGHFEERLLIMAEDWMREFGYELPLDSADFRRLVYELAKASRAASEARRARDRGELVPTPDTLIQKDAPAPSAEGVPPLSEVVRHFLDHYDQTKPMYRKHATVLPMLVECLGDRRVDQIKQMDVEEFFKLVCKLPPRWYEARCRKVGLKELAALEHPQTVAPKTFRHTYIASVRPFLATARRIFGDRGFPAHLTTEGITYRGGMKAGANKQRAFRPDELRLLFTQLEPFAGDPAQVHKVWLPLLALYTGARVNELCQINPQTDAGEEHGVSYLHFTEDTEGDARVRKTIKNHSSRRKVPIHSALLAAGFMDYVQAVRAQGERLLFPQWKPSKGKASGEAEKWFRRWLQDAGLRDETPGRRIVGLHAFRSTFLARAHNLRIADAELLTGHAGAQSAVVRGYQGELELPHKREIMERLSFDVSVPRPVAPDHAPSRRTRTRTARTVNAAAGRLRCGHAGGHAGAE